MRKIITATVTTLGVFAAVGLPTTAAAGKTRHFTVKLVGAPVSANEFLFEVRGPGGYRAALVTLNPVSNPTGGTDRSTLFDSRGTIVSTNKYTNGTPQNGVIPQTGTGHSISGTGIYRHVKETFSFKGFNDVKNRRLQYTESVTETL